MTLKRQLLLVSLLTLILPWAGCEFIRETESALRAGQQQMLAGTARALAESLQQYADEFPRQVNDPAFLIGDELYAHGLDQAPVIDGYFNDWPLTVQNLRSLRGSEGDITFALGVHQEHLFLYVSVRDREVVYAQRTGAVVEDTPPYSDRVSLVSAMPPNRLESLEFAAEAPGIIVAYRKSSFGIAPAQTIRAVWQDGPRGYQLEARIPRSILGTHLGLTVSNTADANSPPVRSSSFSARSPGRLTGIRPELQNIALELVQPGTRLLLTDSEGWRIGNVGELRSQPVAADNPVSAWLQVAYQALVEPGTEAQLADPDTSGREQQPYILSALRGETAASWFRSSSGGSAVVAVAEPVLSGSDVVGAVILQQGTEEILSLTNEGLARLLNVTLLSTILVAGVLLGYATWLSRRIRHLSVAAEDALDGDRLADQLPSHNAPDEIGDLSRSFTSVLNQLGEYNEYLRTLASKLSHELRTPLAIVTSSLENLEHEELDDSSARYTARAKDGADRLRKILAAMSEASRVEELVKHAELERFDLKKVLSQATRAYQDVYPSRRFELETGLDAATIDASPDLLVQMLDKLVDNAVDFSAEEDLISIALLRGDQTFDISVTNPGPPLPETMRTQLFDSMVSVRSDGDSRHLGLGLYVARLIAEGHGGILRAANTEGGVCFTCSLPRPAD